MGLPPPTGHGAPGPGSGARAPGLVPKAICSLWATGAENLEDKSEKADVHSPEGHLQPVGKGGRKIKG